MSNKTIELNEADFSREVLDATQPVLVEFWAGWSEPCRVMTRMLAAVGGDDAVPVKIARVNIELDENLTEQCGVRSVPALLLFSQGRLRDRFPGLVTEQAVRERIRRADCAFIPGSPPLLEPQGIQAP